MYKSKKYLLFLLRNNIYVPSKKLTGLTPREFIFFKWKYSKEIRYAKNHNIKAKSKKN